MTKIRLNILGLSYSQTQSGAYALVLAEENGERRIPIIIGGAEAQAIAIQLEGLKPLRPLTHDLFLNLAKSFNITLIEVNIYKLEEGIFHSELICNNGKETIKIDARTSDAVALAIRFKCPIFTTEKIISKAGIVIDSDEKEETNHNSQNSFEEIDNDDLSSYSVDELNTMLEDAVSEEKYEQASLIRDEIKRREEQS